ncbi:MAG: MerR family transcriptional regulator [bacterium]
MSPKSNLKTKSAAKAESVIPDKLYFKIGEVAEIVGVKPYVLRYWETEFPDIAPGKSRTNQRLYKRKELEKILQIRDLLYREKYTINGARKRLKELERGEKIEEKTHQVPLFSPTMDKDFLRNLKGELQSLLELYKE